MPSVVLVMPAVPRDIARTQSVAESILRTDCCDVHWPAETLFVTYAGPQCNGAARAALHFAELGCAVGTMVAGVIGGFHEGFKLAEGANA